MKKITSVVKERFMEETFLIFFKPLSPLQAIVFFFLFA
jgi:hypothetical protein